MRLENEPESQNVEDHRGESGGFRFPGGGGPSAAGGRGGFGLVTTLVLFGLAMLFGFDPRAILGGGGGGAPAPRVDANLPRAGVGGGRVLPPGQGADDLGVFVSKVLHTTEDVWTTQFRAFGLLSQRPESVSGCQLFQ